MSKFICFLFVVLLFQSVDAQQPQQPQQQNQRRQQRTITVEQIMQQLPEGVTFIPDIAYREGNEAWKLDLAMPTERGESLRPALVFIHGGGWRGGDKRRGGFLRPTISYAAKGYVCVTVNYRMLDEAPITACVEDVKNAVRWLRAHAEEYNIDPERIGASGNSAGAHLAVMLGVCPPSAGLEGDGPYQAYSSMVQAVVASATPTDFLSAMSDRQRNQQRARPPRKNELRLESEAVRAKTVSCDLQPRPMHRLFCSFTQYLIAQLVSIIRTSLVNALREAGAKNVSYILLGDESGHGAFQRNIAFTEPAREAFFNRVLKPGE